ncbi:MAG: tetratricopeptide repeat protein [Dokdonella sp.]
MHERRCRFSGIFLAEFLPTSLTAAKSMSALEKPIYRFGEFELDPDERRLLARGEPVTLTPKVFDTLMLLVERAGHAVSKDELMRVLWPRGFVDESNLTKHIWLIRKALDEGEHDTRWIETIPKLGYRFVAAVQRIERAPEPLSSPESMSTVAATSVTSGAHIVQAHQHDDAQASVSVDAAVAESAEVYLVADAVVADSRPRSSRRRMLVATAVVGIVVATSLLAWRFFADESKAPIEAATGTAVAIVQFNNLSQNAKDAWLGPALGEMLATEITAGGRLHALPDELVRPAHADLAIPMAGGYAAQSLFTLHRRLGADYVLSGSYLVSGAADQPHVRLDLALQDARKGVAVANFARDAAVSELPSLIAQAGVGLRDSLGIATAKEADLRQIANVQPPTAEVARHIGFALDALHHNDPARARDELLDAVAQAPGYAPGYSYLAQAWAALGYGKKAAAAAEQAAAHAQGLPEEQRLQIELQRQVTKHEWAAASKGAAALVALRPQDPNYRLRQIGVLLSARSPNDLDAALSALRALPGAASDPRTELAASDVASEHSDAKGAAAHARAALALAHARDEPGQIADAQVSLGAALSHLGENEEAQAMLRKAIVIYQHAGNPHGEAAARDTLGKTLASADGNAAREQYQRAMSIYQSIGDLDGVAATYTDLSRMLWTAGDRDGAQTAVQNVLKISRESGDLSLQVWSLQALATAASDESASDEVLQDFRQVIDLDEQASDKGGLVWSLTAYADVLRMRGDLSAAAAACRRAEGYVAQLSDPQFAIVAAFNCAAVAMDSGDIEKARAGFNEASRISRESRDPTYEANSELSLGQLDLDDRQWDRARTRLRGAAAMFAKAEASTGEADAQALLALCEEATGNASARDAAAARASDLRSRITARQEVFMVDIALARLHGDSAQRDVALNALRDLAADAEKRHWITWSLESRLVLWQLLEEKHDSSAQTLLHALKAEARAHGFARILHLIDAQAA